MKRATYNCQSADAISATPTIYLRLKSKDEYNLNRRSIQALSDIFYKIYNRLENERHLSKAVIEQDVELLYNQLIQDIKSEISKQLIQDLKSEIMKDKQVN